MGGHVVALAAVVNMDNEDSDDSDKLAPPNLSKKDKKKN